MALSAAIALTGRATAANEIDASDPYARLKPVRFAAPEFMTFPELLVLSNAPKANPELQKKLKTLLTTPIISNEAFYRGERPRALYHPLLGPTLRVASWNIEKSIHMRDAITVFTRPRAFSALMDRKKVSPGTLLEREILAEQLLLATSDIIILQEMDIGHKRSGYLDAARELAEALDMNYAYGVEQLEIDPAYLGTAHMKYETGEADEEAAAYFRADPDRYKGLFGSAVLSRYPIKNVEVFQLKHQAYDWYSGEKAKLTFLERSRRLGAKTVFLNELHREMKIGGRIFFRVDLHVPGLPFDTLTVVNIHLEIKCLPKGRKAQLVEILSYIKDIRNPVIMAGDFNSAPSDLSATSVTRVIKRVVKDPTTWLTLGIRAVSPEPLIVNATRAVSNVTKNLQNPVAPHIPIVAPNKVRGLFDAIEDFRFKNGQAFDFRGDPARSVNAKDGKLANANERDLKGFKTTFSVKRSLVEVIGKYRLDWFFVKSFLTDPLNRRGPYRFAPHFGQTLEELNTSLKQPISDHHPNVINLPFGEPDMGTSNK